MGNLSEVSVLVLLFSGGEPLLLRNYLQVTFVCLLLLKSLSSKILVDFNLFISGRVLITAFKLTFGIIRALFELSRLVLGFRVCVPSVAGLLVVMTSKRIIFAVSKLNLRASSASCPSPLNNHWLFCLKLLRNILFFRFDSDIPIIQRTLIEISSSGLPTSELSASGEIVPWLLTSTVVVVVGLTAHASICLRFEVRRGLSGSSPRVATP